MGIGITKYQCSTYDVEVQCTDLRPFFLSFSFPTFKFTRNKNTCSFLSEGVVEIDIKKPVI